MRILCRQRILLPIALVLRKSVRVTENAKNASNITITKASCLTVQDKHIKKHIFQFLLSAVVEASKVKSPTSHARTDT